MEKLVLESEELPYAEDKLEKTVIEWNLYAFSCMAKLKKNHTEKVLFFLFLSLIFTHTLLEHFFFVLRTWLLKKYIYF